MRGGGGAKNGWLERSDSKNSMPPSYITDFLSLVASLLPARSLQEDQQEGRGEGCKESDLRYGLDGEGYGSLDGRTDC